MLRKFLMYVQQQPRESRERYAFAGAVVATFLVVVVWGSYLAIFPNASRITASLGQSQVTVANSGNTPETNTTAPLSGFWGQLKESAAELRSLGTKTQAIIASSSQADSNQSFESSEADGPKKAIIRHIDDSHASGTVATSSDSTTDFLNQP